MTNLEFRRVDSVMSNIGYTRYDVLIGADLIGQVFPYYPEFDSKTHRWLAQATDGTVCMAGSLRSAHARPLAKC